MQRKLIQAGVQIPVIFITGHGDIPMTVNAMKSGAVNTIRSSIAKANLACGLLSKAGDHGRVSGRLLEYGAEIMMWC